MKIQGLKLGVKLTEEMKVLISANAINQSIYQYQDSLYLDSEDSENLLNEVNLISEKIQKVFEFVEIENYNNGKRAVWHRIA